MVGLQPKSGEWVISKEKYFDESGSPIEKENSAFIWSFECLASKCDKVSPSELIPEVVKDLDTGCLHKLMGLLRSATRHNFFSALLVVGGALAGTHFRKIIDHFGGFSILIAFGPTETGKSTSIRAALSILGCQRAGFYSKGTSAYMMERSALSCFPYAIDDPNMGSYAGRKQLDVGELIVDLYNGAKTANLRSGALQPCSAPIIATNTPPKEDPRLFIRTFLATV